MRSPNLKYAHLEKTEQEDEGASSFLKGKYHLMRQMMCPVVVNK